MRSWDLHLRRWNRRGGSSLDESALAFLRDAAGDLADRGEMRLCLVELGAELICVAIFLAAGGEVLYFNSGFDEAHGDLKPGLVALFAAVADAFVRGDRRVDLGGGALQYKLHFTSENAPICWTAWSPGHVDTC